MDIPPSQPYYGPYPYPYAPKRPAINGLAIASLVLGIVCVLPPLGLVLGIVALVQIKKRGEGGKGLAVAGVVLSSLSTGLALLLVIAGASGEILGGLKGGIASAGSTSGLVPGDCFDVPGGVGKSTSGRFRDVSCAGSHDGEVTGEFKVADTATFPGKAAIAVEAEKQCWVVNDAYAMDIWAVPDGAEMFYYPPTASSWRHGDRTVSCAYVIEDGTFHGSLRNDARSLDEDQVTFLTAADSIDRALWQSPDEDADEDLPANKAWARDVASILFREGEGLRSSSWNAQADAPVAALTRDIQAARTHWVKAADATDEDAFWAELDEADKVLGAGMGLDVRKVLGLDTTPPAPNTSGGSGDGSGDASV
ncbi:DUF4190 domain-containing protein [Streptomyces beijiangensis]|uniref:DUF4190 domain-containing protein n=1 Tax=Streptomyces beijiangensis TaxID=163361 RepID=A0A939F0Z5_9ACTN|nr:DUF4190 domain-containing protein [Streptomyces beijiangensis]MBO0510516.1 DUF4190 domain-containing protein [Streptomyces beijiangensis]